MRDPLALQHPTVDALPQGPEVAEVSQPPSDAQIVGVVDGGLGTQGALLLEVLLDMAAFVLDIHARGHPVGDHPGSGTGPAWPG